MFSNITKRHVGAKQNDYNWMVSFTVLWIRLMMKTRAGPPTNKQLDYLRRYKCKVHTEWSRHKRSLYALTMGLLVYLQLFSQLCHLSLARDAGNSEVSIIPLHWDQKIDWRLNFFILFKYQIVKYPLSVANERP